MKVISYSTIAEGVVRLSNTNLIDRYLANPMSFFLIDEYDHPFIFEARTEMACPMLSTLTQLDNSYSKRISADHLLTYTYFIYNKLCFLLCFTIVIKVVCFVLVKDVA
jgi:hypothetical protein